MAPVVGAGDHHDGRVGVVGQHLLGEVEAGLAGHVDVAQDEREGLGREEPPRLGSAAGGRAIVPMRLQESRQKRPDLLLVVDDEDAPICAGLRHWPFIGNCSEK